jgi:hypothetical protein
MEEKITYRGRTISAEDICFIRELIARHPKASRRGLSQLLCEAWDWRQANGALRDMVCRGMMLMLHRGGHIELPEKKFTPHNPLGKRRKPATDILLDQRPIEDSLQTLMPLEIRQVRRTSWEPLFDGLIERDHYLGYNHVVGEHLKYMVFREDRPVACLAWSSAPWHMGPRDRFIGWSPAVRKKNLHLIAYNTRYLILPWVRVKHLASHILGSVARRISADWAELYAHPIYYLETFVDRERFAGTCYRAANWQYLGKTTGRGIKDKQHKVTRSKKDVLGYPLSRDFREKLCGDCP